jgi:hypothetical protein
MQAGVVVPGIIDNHHHPSSRSSTRALQLLQELKEAQAIKFGGLLAKHKTSVPEAHRTKIAHAFAGGVWSRIGSLTSGGIHMRQREPCC